MLLNRMAQGEKYHHLRDVLRAALGAMGGQGGASPAAFIVSALDDLSSAGRANTVAAGGDENAASSLIAPTFHLCLEALAGVATWARPPYTTPSPTARCETSAASAVQLFAQAIMQPPTRVIEPRAVLRLAQTFRMTHDDCLAVPGLCAAADVYARQLLLDGHHNAAVLLALQLSLPSVAHIGSLDVLVEANAEALAETLAQELGDAAQHQLVQLCLRERRYKAAVRACRRFDLSSSFPEAESLYTAATVNRLAMKGTWDVAAAIASRSADAQRQLIDTAVASGQAAIALDLVDRFGFADVYDADALTAAAEGAAAADAETYLALGVDLDQDVHFVDKPEQLQAMALALEGAHALGLDAEWRSDVGQPPAEGAAEDSPHRNRVALLQVATSTAVFLIDIPALATTCPDALSNALMPALCGPVLVGVGVAADLSKCASDWPQVRAFVQAYSGRRARPADLRLAWRAARCEDAPPGGLAGAARVALGKPLDKRPRMSDWERRPLSALQRRYAANDAHAALRIWHFLVDGLSADQMDAMVKSISPSAAASSPKPAATTAPVIGDDLEAAAVIGTAAVEAALLNSALPWRLVRTSQDGPTCASAAAALGVPVSRIVKSLGLLLDDSKRILLLLAGDQRADLHAVAAHLGVQRRQLRFATAAECVSFFGHAPGSMPPVGHRGGDSSMRTIMDSTLLNRASQMLDQLDVDTTPCLVVDTGDGEDAVDAQTLSSKEFPEGDLVYAGAGSADMHLAMHVADMRTAACAELAAIAATSGSGQDGAAARGVSVGVPPTPSTTARAFVVDGALGRLGRWLRCLGVDVAVLQENESPMSPSAANMLKDRVLLTRSRTAVAHLAAANVFYVGDGEPREQLAKVRERFGLAFAPERLLSRCSNCNGIVEVQRSPEEVALDSNVPEHIKRTVREFWACSTCAKTFWVGPKSRRAVQLAASLCAETVYGHPLDPRQPLGMASSDLADQIADVLGWTDRGGGSSDGAAFAR